MDGRRRSARRVPPNGTPAAPGPVTGPQVEQGPSRRPRCGSLSWGQRMRAAAGGFTVGAVVGVTLLAAVQAHAVEPSVPVAAVIGLPVDHLTPPGGIPLSGSRGGSSGRRYRTGRR
jgi:hypothetical protein